MTNVLITPLRRVAVLAAFVLALCTISGVAHAQKCICPTVSVDVDINVACDVVFYSAAPLCRYAPVTVRPGGHGDIACCNDMSISLVDVNGVSYTFSVGNPTMYTDIKLANGCCVDAVLKIGKGGCPAIRVTASANPC